MAKGSSSRKASRPLQEANGSAATTPSVASTIAASPASSPSSSLPSRQTDGAYLPASGPITNVRQLMRSPNVAKGSIGSFTTLASYTEHLRGMTSAELHRHAVEEAHVTPIDDRARLVRRLESNWTEVASRELFAAGKSNIPSRPAMSADQVKAQEELRRKMLGGRA